MTICQRKTEIVWQLLFAKIAPSAALSCRSVAADGSDGLYKRP